MITIREDKKNDILEFLTELNLPLHDLGFKLILFFNEYNEKFLDLTRIEDLDKRDEESSVLCRELFTSIDNYSQADLLIVFMKLKSVLYCLYDCLGEALKTELPYIDNCLLSDRVEGNKTLRVVLEKFVLNNKYSYQALKPFVKIMSDMYCYRNSIEHAYYAYSSITVLYIARFIIDGCKLGMNESVLKFLLKGKSYNDFRKCNNFIRG